VELTDQNGKKIFGGATSTRNKLGWLILALTFQLSCSPGERQEVLNFFFEDAPVPGAQKEQSSGSPMLNTLGQEGWGKRYIYQHEGVNKCSSCHRGNSPGGQAVLAEPVPDLCYGCHRQPRRAEALVHAPVEAGRCLSCHNAHRSNSPAILSISQPGLCYQCHEQSRVKSVSGHREMGDARCTKCHEPHAAENKMFLKSKYIIWN
jgi:predicted CXXCH cytochrome family protein